MSKTRVITSAAANIALIKYWGKKPGEGNQPATGSLSIGLENLRTTTEIECIDAEEDLITFDANDAARRRMLAYLNSVRATFATDQKFKIDTANNFPTGTGLASSASGFAALALGLNRILDLDLSDADLSRLAMRGSGSAARSIFGGYVEVINDSDAYAEQIMPGNHWPLSVAVAITDEGEKAIGSSEAMLRTANTSAYYSAWLDSHAADMQLAKQALREKDFEKLADVAESSSLKMHAAIMTSMPAILYWRAATIEVMHSVETMRNNGTPCFFTIDAGSQVKVISPPDQMSIVCAQLKDIPGVHRIIETHVGGDPVVQ